MIRLPVFPVSANGTYSPTGLKIGALHRGSRLEASPRSPPGLVGEEDARIQEIARVEGGFDRTHDLVDLASPDPREGLGADPPDAVFAGGRALEPVEDRVVEFCAERLHCFEILRIGRIE